MSGEQGQEQDYCLMLNYSPAAATAWGAHHPTPLTLCSCSSHAEEAGDLLILLLDVSVLRASVTDASGRSVQPDGLLQQVPLGVCHYDVLMADDML